MGTAYEVRGLTTKTMGQAIALPFKPVEHTSQHSGPYDATTGPT